MRPSRPASTSGGTTASPASTDRITRRRPPRVTSLRRTIATVPACMTSAARAGSSSPTTSTMSGPLSPRSRPQGPDGGVADPVDHDHHDVQPGGGGVGHHVHVRAFLQEPDDALTGKRIGADDLHGQTGGGRGERGSAARYCGQTALGRDERTGLWAVCAAHA